MRGRLDFYFFFVCGHPSAEDCVYYCLLKFMGRITFFMQAISIGTSANGLDSRLLMYIALPFMILLYCPAAPNWFVAPLIVLVVFSIYLCTSFLIGVK